MLMVVAAAPTAIGAEASVANGDERLHADGVDGERTLGGVMSACFHVFLITVLLTYMLEHIVCAAAWGVFVGNRHVLYTCSKLLL